MLPIRWRFYAAGLLRLDALGNLATVWFAGSSVFYLIAENAENVGEGSKKNAEEHPPL